MAAAPAAAPMRAPAVGLGWRSRPSSQTRAASPSKASRAWAAPSMPACRPSTHTSQTTVANIGKASACFSRSIHGPGRGKRWRQPGISTKAMYGTAMPRPSVPNTARASGAGWVTAKPSAAPMNGAVQGLAASTASTPEPKASMPGRCARQLRQPLRQQVAQLKLAHQVQAQGKKQQRQHKHHTGLLQLEAPADGTACRPQGQQHAGQRQKAEHHTGTVGQGMAAQLLRAGRHAGPGPAA